MYNGVPGTVHNCQWQGTWGARGLSPPPTHFEQGGLKLGGLNESKECTNNMFFFMHYIPTCTYHTHNHVYRLHKYADKQHHCTRVFLCIPSYLTYMYRPNMGIQLNNIITSCTVHSHASQEITQYTVHWRVIPLNERKVGWVPSSCGQTVCGTKYRKIQHVEWKQDVFINS